MKRIYIIYYDWPNLSGNHAGMVYLMKELKKISQNQIKLIEIPQSINKWHIKLKQLHFYLLSLCLKLILLKSDNVLFMEYLGNNAGNQTEIAIKLRKWGIKNRFIGLVNLSKNNLL